MKNLFLILFICAGSLLSAQESKLLSPAKFKKGIARKDIQLIDVRTTKEFDAGHIGQAVNINYFAADFKEQLAKLDKEKAVYIYCQGGGRSSAAAKMMVEMGFRQVFDLEGGYEDWKE
ncbi:MAG: rhodanese-like domain-containing protein [Bacteroidota bacterium]